MKFHNSKYIFSFLAISFSLLLLQGCGAVSGSSTPVQEHASSPGTADTAPPVNVNNPNTETLASTTATYQVAAEIKEPIFGITADILPENEDKFTTLTNSIDAIKTKGNVVVRINLDTDNKEKLDHYKTAIDKLHAHGAKVMVNLADSHELYKYKTDEDYRKLMSYYLEAFKGKVDIWEIGNEVNGDWAGWQTDKDDNAFDEEGKLKDQTNEEEKREKKRDTVSKQIAAAYKVVNDYNNSVKEKDKKVKIALTLYYFGAKIGEECDQVRPGHEMFFWAGKYLTADLRNNLDYVFVSMYEEDNSSKKCPFMPRGREIDTLKAMFERLSGLFNSPDSEKSKLGIGEYGPQCKDCKQPDNADENTKGCRTCDSCRKNIADFIPRYYKTYHEGLKAAKATIPRYVGGFFYWYFYMDTVTNKKPKRPREKYALDLLVEAQQTY